MHILYYGPLPALAANVIAFFQWNGTWNPNHHARVRGSGNGLTFFIFHGRQDKMFSGPAGREGIEHISQLHMVPLAQQRIAFVPVFYRGACRHRDRSFPSIAMR